MSETSGPEDIDLTGGPGPGLNEIDLGEWPDLPGEGPTETTRKVEDTRATLAFLLVGLLGALLAALLLMLCLGKLPVDDFAQVAGITVSPLVGLVGAVTGYYYGRTDRS